MSSKQQVQEFAGGEANLGLEQDSSIQLKAASPHGDPVELTADEARLIAMAPRLDAIDSPEK